MSLRDWLVRESTRRRLTVLGMTLSELSAEFETVRKVSSKTVAERIQAAATDYWRAVEMFAGDRLPESKQAMTAAFLQVEFSKKLLAAETAERELGEGDLFELAPSGSGGETLRRIQTNLNQITVEVAGLLDAASGLSD